MSGDETNLVGKTVWKVFTNKDRTAIKFETESGYIGFVAEGECCSTSWFEHANFVKFIYLKKVTGVEFMEEDGSEDEKSGEYIRVYGLKIHTANGTCYIEMRNSSNGYYGGSLRASDSVDATIPLYEDF